MAPPTIRIAVQNHWYTQPRRYGVLADAWVINSSAFLSTSNDDLATVLARTQAEVESSVAAYLTAHPELTAATTGLVVVDIEGPIIPNNWGTHDLATQDNIVEAWKMRVGVARAALPNAELGSYATINPDYRGNAKAGAYVDRLAALQRAHTVHGAFADVDVLHPILYCRFGPDDGDDWRTVRAYAELGIDGSADIGPALPIKPFLYHTVFNAIDPSVHHEQELLDLPTPDPLGWTWDRILAACESRGISEVVFWIGGTDTDVIAGSGRSIYQYISPARPVRYYF